MQLLLLIVQFLLGRRFFSAQTRRRGRRSHGRLARGWNSIAPGLYTLFPQLRQRKLMPARSINPQVAHAGRRQGRLLASPRDGVDGPFRLM